MELGVLVWLERVLFCYAVDEATGHTPIRPAGAGPFDQCDQREEEAWRLRPI
jgi:hypothetical protein